MSSTTNRWLGGGVVVVVGLVLLARFSPPSAELRVLKEDPLARYEPSGGKLVRTYERGAGTTLGKPVSAQVARLFALPRGRPEAHLRQALAAAAAEGWTVNDDEMLPSSRGTAGQGATKRLGGYRASLYVTLFTTSDLLPDDVSPPALRIALTNQGCAGTSAC